jgi:hypothetical protein
MVMIAGMGLDVANPITLLAVREADGRGSPLYLGALDAGGLHRLAWKRSGPPDDPTDDDPEPEDEFPHVLLTIAADGRVTIADGGDGPAATLRAEDEGRALVVVVSLIRAGAPRPAAELNRKGCV